MNDDEKLDTELRQALLDMGESEGTIELMPAESKVSPFGDDARTSEDEYPHGFGRE